jgi:cobalt-zinc-cadmium efflux system membrane fusion protein
MTESTPNQSSRTGILGYLKKGIPTVAMIALLAGIGYWGHHNGWKIPKFSQLVGKTQPTDDWCSEHPVPESECVECNPSLLPRPKSRGWCKIHGVHECTLCNPELAQLTTIPKITPEDLDKALRSLQFADRPTNSAPCKVHERRIQFANLEAVDKAGIEVDVVSKGEMVEFIRAPGEIAFDQTRIAHLSSRTGGSVWRVFKHVGDTASEGELLALIDSAEVGKAKSELLQAAGFVELKKQTIASLDNSEVASEARLREARAALREGEIRLNAARQALVNLGLPLELSEIQGKTVEQLEAKLHFLGIPSFLTQKLDPKQTTSNLLPLVAPMTGVIVSQEVVAGEVTDPTRILFELVDVDHLWIHFDVRIEDARKLRKGLPVRFQPDGSKEELTGELAWISSQADPKTRTVRVRANLSDPQHKLRANTFGFGRIILRDEPSVVVVPPGAIHSDGDCTIVFVRDKHFLKDGSPKVFHTRTVRIGGQDDKSVEIVAGVLPGEVIATKNSGVLRAELLRANLGEG